MVWGVSDVRTFGGKILTSGGDIVLEFLVACGVDPKRVVVRHFLYEYPLTPSQEGKELFIEALKKMEETDDSADLLRTISKVATEENLDPYRTASTLYICSLAKIKRYAQVAYKACVHMLGL